MSKSYINSISYIQRLKKSQHLLEKYNDRISEEDKDIDINNNTDEVGEIIITELNEQSELEELQKEKEIVERMLALENKMIPDNFDYDKLSALSIEALQKFKKIRPLTIGQASRISGVNPSDIQILMVFIGR